MRAILRFLQASRRLFFLTLVSGLFAGLSASGIVALLHRSLNGGLESDYGLFLLLFIAAWIGYGLFNVLAMFGLTRLTQDAVLEIRLRLCRQILSAGFPAIEREKSRLLAVLTNDIQTVTVIVERIPASLIGLFTILGIFGYLAFLSPGLLGFVSLILAAGFWIYWLPLKRFKHSVEMLRESWSRLFDHFEAILFGAKELYQHLPRRREFMERAIKATSETQRRQAVRANTLEVLMSRWGELYLLLGLGLLVFLSPFVEILDIQELSQFVFICIFLLAPIGTLTGFLMRISRLQVALQRIEQVGLDLREHQADPSGLAARIPLPPSPRSIRLHAVSYSYPVSGKDSIDRGFTLGPVDLDICPGEILFLTGGNGSGKTTLAKVICGLYPAQEGNISLDHLTVSPDALPSYRDLFSAVFADFYLFDAFYGIPESVIRERVGDILNRLEIADKFSLNGGPLPVQELSSGQRKRLALGVALLEDRPFIVLDEWAAEQDAVFKDTFYRSLLPALKAQNKGIIVISHDDRFFPVADRIVTLSEGRITSSSHQTKH